jgi:predicted acetyltransferase
MLEVYLVKLSIEFEQEYLGMIDEWRKSGKKFTPWILKFDTSDFPAFIEKLEVLNKGIGVSSNSVKNSTYWLIDENNRVIGAINIKYKLNESLIDRVGYVEYGIRPSERRKGYETEMLRQALVIVKAIGIKKVIITCDKEDIRFAKITIKNVGVLESGGIFNGMVV